MPLLTVRITLGGAAPAPVFIHVIPRRILAKFAPGPLDSPSHPSKTNSLLGPMRRASTKFFPENRLKQHRAPEILHISELTVYDKTVVSIFCEAFVSTPINAVKPARKTSARNENRDDSSAAPEEQSLVTEIYNQILAQIVRGELPGGSELKSTHLAGELGVSRTPVVQALARLQADGIITQRLNMRAVVRPEAENWLVQIHDLRLLLEPAAAARAAAHMPSEAIAHLERIAELAAPCEDPAWDRRARDFDFDLHLGIADYANNEPLRSAIHKCWQYKRLSYELGPDRREALVRGYQDHLLILAAIKARDPDTASAAMELHLRHASSHRPSGRVV